MSHVEYTKEDSRKDLSASLMGLAAGVALTFNDDLRASLLGSGSASAEQPAGSSDVV